MKNNLSENTTEINNSISPYSIPGIKKRKYISHYDGKSIVSISAKYGYILFSLEAVNKMGLSTKDKIKYVILDSMICLYRASDGLRCAVTKSDAIKVQSRPLARILQQALKKARRNSKITLRYSLFPTNSYLQESQLFELRPPSEYKKYLSSLIIPNR